MNSWRPKKYANCQLSLLPLTLLQDLFARELKYSFHALKDKFDKLAAPLPRPDVLYGAQPAHGAQPSLPQLHYKPPARGHLQHN